MNDEYEEVYTLILMSDFFPARVEIYHLQANCKINQHNWRFSIWRFHFLFICLVVMN